MHKQNIQLWFNNEHNCFLFSWICILIIPPQKTIPIFASILWERKNNWKQKQEIGKEMFNMQCYKVFETYNEKY